MSNGRVRWSTFRAHVRRVTEAVRSKERVNNVGGVGVLGVRVLAKEFTVVNGVRGEVRLPCHIEHLK